MNKIFIEFENENALRTYPFASGCLMKDTSGNKISTGILIDAALYPVNPEGSLYLSRISSDGVVEISDSKKVIMRAMAQTGSSDLEFYDTSVMSRHVGTVIASSPEALATLTNVYEDRIFREYAALFASSCVFPIVNDGVTSITVGNAGSLDGLVKFANADDDDIRVSTDGSTLRFDVVPPLKIIQQESIQHIYCIVDGKTPFRIEKIPFFTDSAAESSSSSPSIGNTIAVYLDNIQKQDVCNNAHRENALEMADTCDCGSSSSCHDDPEPPAVIPETYQVEVVDIPNFADSAFYFATPNMLGYENPLSLTLTDGAIVPKTEIDVEIGGDNIGKLADDVTSKGAILQVPGLK